MPSSGRLHSSYRSALEMVRRMQHSQTVIILKCGLSCVLIEMLILVQVCDCAANNGPFRKHYFNRCENPDDDTHGVPKYIGGDFVHL
jgi:hypothetical protein